MLLVTQCACQRNFQFIFLTSGALLPVLCHLYPRKIKRKELGGASLCRSLCCPQYLVIPYEENPSFRVTAAAAAEANHDHEPKDGP